MHSRLFLPLMVSSVIWFWTASNAASNVVEFIRDLVRNVLTVSGSVAFLKTARIRSALRSAVSVRVFSFSASFAALDC